MPTNETHFLPFTVLTLMFAYMCTLSYTDVDMRENSESEVCMSFLCRTTGK